MATTTTPQYNYRPTVPMTYASYRPGTYPGAPASQMRTSSTITDDYERWYTEPISNNRMALSLKCGIDEEIAWALDRLCRLCNNDQFILKAIPGLTSALFLWPEWFLDECAKGITFEETMFSSSPKRVRKQRHALNSIFILGNASMNEPNAVELAGNPRTMALISRTLGSVKPECDVIEEFVLHAMELFHTLVSTKASAPALSLSSIPISVVENLANDSQNRSMIIACLSVLSHLVENPLFAGHLSADSPALAASLRYLPLFIDKDLVDACLNYLYAHLAHPSMTKAFLLHPCMPSTLKLLVSLLISEQVEETVTVDIGETARTASAVRVNVVNYELRPDEKESLAAKTEPERCFEWMKTMFVANAESELTQVNFWNLYKDTFTPYQDRHPLLVASDVIKNVSVVFTAAQAMVLQGPPQKFVVRGVDRRKEEVEAEHFKCQWDRSKCTAITFQSAQELFAHVRTHLDAMEQSTLTLVCSWATCDYVPPGEDDARSATAAALQRHVLTHMTSASASTSLRPPSKTLQQPDRVSLSSTPHPHPTATPTERPVPPPPKTTVAYQAPKVDPTSSSLTALLIIRALFQASFVSSEAAPRADADHFGFPWALDSDEQREGWEDLNEGVTAEEREKEGERRGRRAFVGVRKQLEGVRIKEATLMSWITEMADVGLTELNP